jgi:hypothetical protein
MVDDRSTLPIGSSPEASRLGRRLAVDPAIFDSKATEVAEAAVQRHLGYDGP